MPPSREFQAAPRSRENARIRAAIACLHELLVPQETLDAIAVQRRIFALRRPRIIVGATSGRLMLMTRGLLGGFQVKDVRWQDLKDAKLRVGIIGATLTVTSLASSDLAMGSTATPVIEIGGLRKNEALKIYTLCQTHEQAWREKRRVREMEELRAKSGGITLGSTFGAPATADRVSVAHLERAREMRDRGLISDVEYEALKAKLVSSL
jgi:putative oligomerization/nucleic acid binding protein